MAIPNFFKQNKPRGFNYSPRYYDPKKEEREARLMAQGMKQESGDREKEDTDSKPYKSKILPGSMRNYFPRSRERVERHNLIRIMVIILILILIAYFFLRF
jgi:hypothetical protein